MMFKKSASFFSSIFLALSFEVCAMEAPREDSESSSKTYSPKTQKRNFTKESLETSLKDIESSSHYVQCLLDNSSLPDFSFRNPISIRHNLSFVSSCKRQLHALKQLRFNLDFHSFFDQMERWLTTFSENHYPNPQKSLSHLGRTWIEEHLTGQSVLDIIDHWENLTKSHPRSIAAIKWFKESFPKRTVDSYETHRKKLEETFKGVLAEEETRMRMKLDSILSDLTKEKEIVRQELSRF
ncbi:MAG: hypothetical protein B7Y25_06650 [Alphaproteobacteria bacterium 16-39-46]|nr:MAG: hypothetical protein B7Y25_06650 [Alphaproteobacteria bacterium 16-39-46]OZA42237.1 MAG: hypothetical protein B7X84_06725 [Alphaproteobacteria bacterium 17-39-52]HQS84562.1 hypothetical protein [Alphaproteobacteria bacterium]HQS94352.1 hypothetical protein [Alphaproteobacteria bacterium]